MRYVALIGGLAILLFMAACGDGNSIPASTAIPGPSAPTNQPQGMPTTTPSPQPPGSITPVPASESYRLDLGVGVVVSFVEGLSPEMPDKVAYVTHVPSGSQAVLDRDGQIIDRHDGRGDGPRRLDAVLQDRAAMRRIVEGLKNDEDVRPRETLAEWAHSVQFGGITYLAKGSWFGSMIANGERAMTADDLGPELYRVAFRRVGYAGSYRYLDGDATYLNPGTPVYAVKGYVPEFRLATLEEGRVTLFEADTNPLATTGEDLLDIRGKVTAVRILSTDYARTVLGTIDEESQVERFVELVLQSPVDQEHRDHEGLLYFLDFRLADGTSVVRSFWLESGELWRGIMTDPIVASIALSSLPNDHEMEVQTPITAKSPSPTGTPTPMPMPTPERDRPEGPPQGPGAEIGIGYPYTLYVHCGVRDARFDGRLWMADPMLSDGSGNPPLDWTAEDSDGIMELIEDDLAVFTAESGRIIEFTPWPSDVELSPCF